MLIVLQVRIKKRLLKVMPHIPILELRPELREQNEVGDDIDDPQDGVENEESNAQGINEENDGEIEAIPHFMI